MLRDGALSHFAGLVGHCEHLQWSLRLGNPRVQHIRTVPEGEDGGSVTHAHWFGVQGEEILGEKLNPIGPQRSLEDISCDRVLLSRIA